MNEIHLVKNVAPSTLYMQLNLRLNISYRERKNVERKPLWQILSKRGNKVKLLL